MEQYNTFILTGDKALVDTWLAQIDAMYAVGNAAVTDEMYDQFIMLYEGRFGPRFVIGAPPPAGKGVQLPIAMMSLDKIKTTKELDSFTGKNPGPYVVLDKINGQAGLYEIMGGQARLYNRGDGVVGTDVTPLLKYLHLPVLPFDVHVKGEFVIYKKDHQANIVKYKTNLGMINGLIKEMVDGTEQAELLKLFKFIVYDLSFPNNPQISLKMSDTMKYLLEYGFTTPMLNVEAPALTIDWLSQVYKRQKEYAPYDVDGLVVIADRPVQYDERLIRTRNPTYSVAFKEYDIHEAVVDHVEWEASKNNMIKPVVHVVPVKLDTGFTIRKATGFNAKWIVENKVGPGTVIMVTHNTIPYIVSVERPTEPQMPDEEMYPPGSWKWNDTGVDIILLEDNDEVRIARIYEFFKQLDAKYVGETTLTKFYNAGFNTVKKMIETKREEFLAAGIEGVGAGIIDRMITNIAEAIPRASVAQLMSASGAFGHGFGVRKITAILDEYPNVYNENRTVEEIKAIKGFAEITAKRFIEGLPKFRAFINDIPLLGRALRGELAVTAAAPVVMKTAHISPVGKPTGQSLNGMAIVMTGFRDKGLEAAIVARGGTVKTAVSGKTNYLILGGVKGENSTKEKKANELGVPVVTVGEFKGMFGL